MKTLPVITDPKDYPFCISDRFGAWHAPANLPEPAKELLNKFIETFGNESGQLRLGDPRAFMGGNETSLQAVKDGRFGLLTEIELDFSESDGSIASDQSISEQIDGDEFAARLRAWSDRLATLAPEYPLSEFFMAHGAPTFDGRACLCAFTPVTVGWNCHCEDPYLAQGNGKSIAALDAAIGELVWNVPCDLEYDRYDESGAQVKTGLTTKARVHLFTQHVTEHHLQGLIATGEVIPTAVIRDGKRYAVRCNGDQITAEREDHPIEDHPRKGAPKP